MSKISLMLVTSILLLLGSSGLGFMNNSKLADKQAEVASIKASQTPAQNDVAKAKDAQK